QTRDKTGRNSWRWQNRFRSAPIPKSSRSKPPTRPCGSCDTIKSMARRFSAWLRTHPDDGCYCVRLSPSTTLRNDDSGGFGYSDRSSLIVFAESTPPAPRLLPFSRDEQATLSPDQTHQGISG